MNADRTEEPTDGEAEFQREVLKGRKFTLGEAIGRMAGGGPLTNSVSDCFPSSCALAKAGRDAGDRDLNSATQCSEAR